jgi:hypothetical protein
MTRRKKVAVAGIAVALVLAAGLGLAVALRPSSLERKLDRIRDGMTYAEVVAILGEPTTASRSIFDSGLKLWEEGRGQAWVQFDIEGRACWKDFTRNEPSNFLDRVLAWIGL